jgi:hypothetical protein
MGNQVSFDLLRLDSWEGEAFTVYLDDEPLFSQRFYNWQNTDASTGDTNGINWSLTPTTDWTELYGSNFGSYTSYDQRFRVSLQLPAGRMAVKLGFGSGLNQAADDESYAIDNLEIRSADNPLIAVNTFDTADGWAGGAISELAGAGSVLGPYAAQAESWQLWRVNPSGQQLESVEIPGLEANAPDSISEIVALGSRVFFRYQTWSWWSGSSFLYSIDPETGVAHQVDVT